MRGLHEIVPITDTTCSSLGGIERLSGNLYRFWFYVEQTDDVSGGMMKIVVMKLVMPASSVPDAVLKTLQAMVDPGAALMSLVPSMVN